MRNQQSGFTLIELVAVIVILGALAVVALPRFVDLQTEAEQAAVEGVAGNISSAFSVNYADKVAADTFGGVEVQADDTITIDGNGALTVAGNAGLLTTDDLGDYSISSCTVDSTATQGDSGECTVSGNGENATFTWIATQ